MRNTDEYVAAVKQRVKKIERQRKIRRNRMIAISYTATGLLVIIGLSFLIHNMITNFPETEYTYSGGAASIFNMNSGFGYVLIGLLAFAFGVSITILCHKIQLRNQEDNQEGMNTINSSDTKEMLGDKENNNG